MARQTVNIGTSANKGDGDPLRLAFTKINSNFSELYAGNFVEPTALNSSLIANADGTLSLGSATNQWQNLYVKDFIYLDGKRISMSAGGALMVNNGIVQVTDVVGSVFADDSKMMMDALTGTLFGPMIGDVTGSLFADDSTVMVDAVGKLFIGNLVGDVTGSLTGPVVGDITSQGASTFSGTVELAGATVNNATFNLTGDVTGTVSSISNHSTTDLSEGTNLYYTDARVQTVIDTNTAGFATSTYVDGQIANVSADHFNFNITGDDSTVRSVGSGSTISIAGGTAITTASDANGNITITGVAQDFAFGSITGKPTTLAGYGISDAYTQTQVNTAITNATSSIVVPEGSTQSIDVVASDSTVLVDSVNGTLNAATLTGTLPAIDGSSLTGLLKNVVEDTTPQLGGDLDCQGFNITMDNGIISTSAGNLQLSSFNYVTMDSANNGQIEIGVASGLGNVRIGNESNGTQVSIEGEAFIQERAMFDKGVEEKFATLTGSTGVTAMDCANGHVHYLTGASGDITANFTNLGLTAEYATNLTVIINQGATPYEVTAVQIGGAAQTINWQGGSAPTGNANGIDAFSFTILNDGGSYVVLGQMVDFT